ncbi:MAG TPA: P-loop NTPase fold protein [Bellilinea sp.]|nr:P-loop NTPase fold protein [Bellilinea sp.]
MWHDNETDRDFLNFTSVAETVAEIIIQARGRPISIGVSGAWGVGKSSLIMLIRKALAERIEQNRATSESDNTEFVFVEFNAWLYQGYDDARAALMEVIATKLKKEAEIRQSGVEKVKELLKRVNWLRVAKLTAGSTIALGLGLPPIGLWGELFTRANELRSRKPTEEDIVDLEDSVSELAGAASGIFKPELESSPPKAIQGIRDSFEEALSEMGIKLVVLIDDLDRCLPSTTISTLEAIRLFLFLKNTAFVIAADDAMIKHAVRRHFDGVEEGQVASYFDKLIQVPIRVPPLGTQEVRAYLMMLYVETSSLDDETKEQIRTRVCERLGQTWLGERVDRAFMQQIHNELPAELITKFDSAELLAPIMTSATNIAGNPRLIKRFLNALSIRMAIARVHGVNVDEAALAKMLLFERCGKPTAYAALVKAINEDEEGKPRFLAQWEEMASVGQSPDLDEPWNEPFVEEWLALTPKLSDLDLRGVIYVSREHIPLITPEDRLSSEGAGILAAILQQPEMASGVQEEIARLPRQELMIIMNKLLGKARQEQEWGTPPILDACLTLIAVDPVQGQRFAAFLKDLPEEQIRPDIIPKIGDQPWVKEVFDTWYVGTKISGPVKRAIEHQRN